MSQPIRSATINATDALFELAKQRLGEPGNFEQGRKLLEALSSSFPATAAAAEAQRLLPSLPAAPPPSNGF